MAHLYLVDFQQRLIPGERVALVADEARHAAKAARLRVGEQVLLGDGHGTLAQAEATTISAERVELVVVSTQHHERVGPPLWLVQSLAKSGRDEHAIEQATEVGVDRVVPLQADRSVVRWEAEKQAKQCERWRKIVTEATKQSLQAYLPEVDELTTVAALVSRPGVQFVALDHRGDQSLLDIELVDPAGDTPIALLVGPEGGWSDQERNILNQAGVAMAKLGPGVLRASSAGPIALALLHSRLQHW